MKKFTFITTLISVCALCFALVGCGDKQANDEAFVGWWELESIESEGTVLTTEDFAMIADLGANGFLFNEDGTLVFYLTGDSTTGTWEAIDADSLKATIDGESMTFDLIDGKLTVAAGSDKMVCVSAPMPDFDSATTEATESTDKNASDVTPDNIIIDDDDFTIAVSELCLDDFGDVAMKVKITNKTDQAVDVTVKSGSFAVNDEMSDPWFYASILPGKSSTEVLSLDAEGVETVADVITMEGVFDIYSNEDYSDIAEYDFWYE